MHHYLRSLLARACLSAGRPDEGLRVIDEALAGARTTGQVVWEPEFLRLRSELLLATSPTEVAGQSNGCAVLLPSPTASRRGRGSDARPRPSRACSSPRASAMRRAACSATSTVGSSKASAPPDLQEAKALLEEVE